MDRSIGTAAQPRTQDVTPQIAKSHIVYGASDNTNPMYSSANKSLNYSIGGNINTPELENLKTGNKYIDTWFDVRLYKSNREEHPYDKMFVRDKDHFYIGFHARNTKRLPYNVKCTVGQQLIFGLPEEERRYINSVV